MGYCLVHNQSYCEHLGGYCTYCGPPETKQITYDSTSVDCCKECGAVLPNHYIGCHRQTTSGQL
jgi:translation initiation factor 2 beta subunit (eIF-2beta)/eIF-5